jgi:hypothetical protein
MGFQYIIFVFFRENRSNSGVILVDCFASSREKTGFIWES